MSPAPAAGGVVADRQPLECASEEPLWLTASGAAWREDARNTGMYSVGLVQVQGPSWGTAPVGWEERARYSTFRGFVTKPPQWMQWMDSISPARSPFVVA